MAGTCVFCGFNGRLTGEHVFGDWLTRVGLDLEPVVHGAGPLNRSTRDLGISPPFRRTVRNVCGPCNNGWMSRLEDTAKRVLRPLILGEPGTVQPADQGTLAAWAEKTALVAMLVSSEEDRANGYGLPVSEYRELYFIRAESTPLPASQFWIGRYDGARTWSVWVTPLVVAIDGLPEPGQPQAYVMTIVLGQVVLHGVRFTTPSLQLDLSTSQELPQLWPAGDRVDWPAGTTVNDTAFLRFSGGKDLRVREPHVALRPWKPATDLPDSRAVGSMIELPTTCGKHVVCYPDVLVAEAMWGRFYAFMTSCNCKQAYFIQTEADGAHCKASGDPQGIAEMYEALPDLELLIEHEGGIFICKQLTDRSEHEARL